MINEVEVLRPTKMNVTPTASHGWGEKRERERERRSKKKKGKLLKTKI